ncbi:hypothetical protein [Acidisoma sp. 7E03]
MVNMPIFGPPASQLPRISQADAETGLGIFGVGRLGTPYPYVGLITPAILAQLLGTSTSGFSLAEMTAFDAMTLSTGRALCVSRKMQTQPIIDTSYNIFDPDGQSFTVGVGGDPLLTTTALTAGVLMVGTNQQFTVLGNGSRVPAGSAALNPLIATGSDEGFSVAATYAFKMLDFGAQGQPPSNGDRAIVSNYLGTGGKTIEQLSYSAAPVAPATKNLFGGKLDVLQSQHDLAVAAGKTPNLTAILFDQGQYNYNQASGTHDAATWAALVGQYIDDTNTYATQAIFSQALPPLWVVQQPGGAWAVDIYQKLGIANGAIMLAQGRPDVVLAQPDFNYPSHQDGAGGTLNGHPTTNAYRWMGCKLAQVLYEVLILGRNWDYMRPLFIWWRGQTIMIGVNPKVGPLRFTLPYAGYTRVAAGAFPNQGFEAVDPSGQAIEISSVSLFGSGTIVIRLASTPSGPPTVNCGGRAAAGGNTFITDSDPWVAPLSWTYAAGMDPSENDPAMVGKPYPMANWLLAFSEVAIAV